MTRRENFIEKFFSTLGFLSGVITFLSGLVMTMTWLHFLVCLGLNVNVSSFLLMLSFMILAATTIVAPVVLKMDVCYQIPLILGRPFLSTAGATIDVAAGIIKLNISGKDEAFTFKPKGVE